MSPIGKVDRSVDDVDRLDKSDATGAIELPDISTSHDPESKNNTSLFGVAFEIISGVKNGKDDLCEELQEQESLSEKRRKNKQRRNK